MLAENRNAACAAPAFLSSSRRPIGIVTLPQAPTLSRVRLGFAALDRLRAETLSSRSPLH